jgi:RNA polymerase sigma-70 factor, ECF subfamily
MSPALGWAIRNPSHGALRVNVLAHAAPRLPAELALTLEQLIERMRHGDERALEELYDLTVGKLYALAIAILRNVDDAEDVVCMTYAYAWSNASLFDRQRANVLGWLLMLCRSRAIDRRRERIAVPSEMSMNNAASDDSSPDELLALIQERSRMHAALEQLSPLRRQLIALAFLQDLSHHQIAQVTGLALGTVKSHLRRGLCELREALERS